MLSLETLIRTKLRLPLIRPGLVARPRLQARIGEGLRGPLTLITAPAGFGKTTLVAACVSGWGMPVAWLSLDRDDNQAGRFLRYLVAALREADPAIGGEVAQLTTAAFQAPPEAILTSLVNDLDAATGEMALVLDDYQFISSPAVHEQVAFLLDHCPQTFHLVIATRSDPPLPLARLRARAQTVELRAADLSFTRLEAAQFLNDSMGLGLDADVVALLAERTEGWIAGLQMASISMRGRDDAASFIAELPKVATAPESVTPAGGLIEPLTQRELEILYLVALGNTNKVIAQQLFIAPGTVKAHTASIYRKLDVANRTEAVARARQVGILP